MENEKELLEAIHTLQQYSSTLAARLSAQEVITDTLLGTLCKSQPHLLPVLQECQLLLADAREKKLPESLREEFRAAISDSDRKMAALK